MHKIIIALSCFFLANVGFAKGDEKTRELAKQNLKPEQKICNGKEAKVLRVLFPDEGATADYMENRLTIWITNDGKIIKSECG